MDTKQKVSKPTKIVIPGQSAWCGQSNAALELRETEKPRAKGVRVWAASVRQITVRSDQNERRGTKRRNLYAVTGYNRRCRDRRVTQQS